MKNADYMSILDKELKARDAAKLTYKQLVDERTATLTKLEDEVDDIGMDTPIFGFNTTKPLGAQVLSDLDNSLVPADLNNKLKQYNYPVVTSTEKKTGYYVGNTGFETEYYMKVESDILNVYATLTAAEKEKRKQIIRDQWE